MTNIIVIGHISPDTDATCSAIAYAWLLNHLNHDATPYVAGSLNKETEFVLKKFAIDTPEVLSSFPAESKVAIVDTNNPKELIDGIENTQIVGIVDHHKLFGGLTTESPIYVTIQPLACTCTIIWNIMKDQGVSELPEDIAGIMLSAILSDTLKFTSPTTTDKDKEAAHELAKICKNDIDTLSEEMFKAKSDLSGLSPEDILTTDSKIFEFGSKPVRISVLETTAPDNALQMSEELKTAMESLKASEKLDHIFFFVVDILKTEATLIVTSDSEKEIAEKAFNASFSDDLLTLPGVVSRKKQIIPALEPVITA